MSSVLKFPVFCCISVLFFFCVNHFDGILQDCMLYTMQAVDFIAPERFAGDAAFTLGTQHRYTLFPQLYAPFILLFPVDKGALFFGALNHFFIAFSIAVLVWKWCKRFHCLPLALPVALLFVSLYSYGEPRGIFLLTMKTLEAFPVPRSLSAGFGFMGLALIFERRMASLALFIVGTLIHPLTCGWALPLWCMYWFPRTRLPIAVASLVFPLTAFIGAGPFAFKTDVLAKPTLGGVYGKQFVEMACCLALFMVASGKMKMPLALRKMTRTFALLLGIAVYLYGVNMFIHHDFLSQVQVFRIQWLYQIMAIFVLAFVLLRLYLVKIRKGERTSLWDKVFLLMMCSLYMDSLFFLILVGLFALFARVPFNRVVRGGLLCVSVGMMLYPCLWIARLQPCLKPEYVYASDLMLVTRFLAISAAIALFLGCVEPRYRKLLCLILLVPIIFVISAGSTFPKENLSLPFLLSSFVWNFLCWVSTSGKNVKCAGPCILAGLMCVCVFLRYDNRPAELREREWAINQFVAQPPFPAVKDRGRILFAEQEFGEEVSRLRYLSGGYYDFQISVGGTFSKALKEETDSHEWYIAGGDSPITTEWENMSSDQRAWKAFAMLFDRDALQKRFTQLCDMREISHLVTDFRFPFPAEDSLTLWYKDKKLFLYPCNY